MYLSILGLFKILYGFRCTDHIQGYRHLLLRIIFIKVWARSNAQILKLMLLIVAFKLWCKFIVVCKWNKFCLQKLFVDHATLLNSYPTYVGCTLQSSDSGRWVFLLVIQYGISTYTAQIENSIVIWLSWALGCIALIFLFIG